MRNNFSVGKTFRFLNCRWYKSGEVFTVTAVVEEGIDCTTSRFPGVSHRITNEALEAYSKGNIGVIEFLDEMKVAA